MIRLVRAAVVALALLVAVPAAAKTNWNKAPLDPAMAYVLVQIDPVEFRMMGNSWVTTGIFLAPYDAQKGAIRLIDVAKKGPQLVRLAIKDGAVAKQGKRRQFFVALPPGTWVIEGTGGDVPLFGLPLTSFSLGSYRFEARAGEVIDLGVIAPSREASDNPDTKMTTGKLLGMALAGPFGGGRVEAVPLKLDFRPRREGDIPLPAWLASVTLTRPAFTYGATFANHLGGLVNRIDGSAGRTRQAGEVVYPAGEPLAGRGAAR